MNVKEAIERRLPKSFIMAMTDNDPKQADATVAKLSQLHALDPDLMILPAHALLGNEPLQRNLAVWSGLVAKKR